MNGMTNENQLTIVEKYEIIKPLIRKIDSIIDECYEECHMNCFHIFKYICIYYIKFTNLGNIEVTNLTISDKNMGSYELNKTLKISRQRGLVFNQINNLTIKIYSNRRYINIHLYLRFQIPMCHRQFFKIFFLKMKNMYKLNVFI